MRRLKSLLIATLICLTSVTGVFAANFTDVKGHWAENYINDVVSKGLATGYENGKFLPDNPTTRIEAVIFASNMHKEETINSVFESSKSKWTTKLREYKIPAWADKYMVFGLEKGIFPETFLKHFVDQANPSKQNYCLRYEFITFMVNSLGFKNEFVSNPKLAFTDAAAINDQVVPYVDVMVRKGIIVGTGKFNPNDRLTRAQVSVILSNSYKYSEKSAIVEKPVIPATEVIGNVVSMTMSNTKATIQIKNAEGSVGIYTAEEGKTSVVGNGVTASLSDVRIGQTIGFVANGSMLTKINLKPTTSLPKESVSGEFVSYSALELIMLVNGSAKTYSINPSIDFKKGTKTTKVIDLKPGDQITVELENNAIVSGSVSTINKTVDGTITEISKDEITVKESTGSYSYTVASDAEMTVDRRIINSVSDLSVGDLINAKVVNSEIVTLTGTTIQRTIKNVVITGIAQGSLGTTITFKDSDDKTLTQTANSDTSYIVKGKSKSLSDIALGYECDIIVKGSKLLTLETQGDFRLMKITGIVENVDIRAKQLIVADSYGDEYTIEIDYNTRISGFNSSEEKTIKSIFEGDNIVVEGTDKNTTVLAKKIIFWK